VKNGKRKIMDRDSSTLKTIKVANAMKKGDIRKKIGKCRFNVQPQF